MSGRLKAALIATIVLVCITAAPTQALASDGSEAPPPEVMAMIAGEEPSWLNPTAHASCPWCAFAAVVAVRAAMAVRTARNARIAIAAAKATRVATKLADKVARRTVKRVQSQARTVSLRGTRWLKRNWQKLDPRVKTCLATAAYMDAHNYLRDAMITRSEWNRYVVFGPRLIGPADSASVQLPMRFTPSQVFNKVEQTVTSCGVGIAVGAHFEKGGNVPAPS